MSDFKMHELRSLVDAADTADVIGLDIDVQIMKGQPNQLIGKILLRSGVNAKEWFGETLDINTERFPHNDYTTKAEKKLKKEEDEGKEMETFPPWLGTVAEPDGDGGNSETSADAKNALSAAQWLEGIRKRDGDGN